MAERQWNDINWTGEPDVQNDGSGIDDEVGRIISANRDDWYNEAQQLITKVKQLTEERDAAIRLASLRSIDPPGVHAIIGAAITLKGREQKALDAIVRNTMRLEESLEDAKCRAERAEAALTAEQEKVRVLRDALNKMNDAFIIDGEVGSKYEEQLAAQASKALRITEPKKEERDPATVCASCSAPIHDGDCGI